ncbi:MAG: hypothetical protein LBB11_04350, partial [Puniceicoccales bacterium]|nr:hypothetical protein [Puniceicoccales bacterium]
MFICTGNTCRSPMAQVFFENQVRSMPEFLPYTVGSAGIRAQAGQKSAPILERILMTRGLSLENHRARLLTPAIVDQAVAMICATSAHKSFLEKNFVNLPKICISFFEFGGDIADP